MVIITMAVYLMNRWPAVISIVVLTAVTGTTCLPAVSLDGALNPDEAILLRPAIEGTGFRDDEEVYDREERDVASGQEEIPPGLSDDEDMTGTPIPPEVMKLAVLSRVTARFASTEVKSKLKNVGKTVSEATFTILLPDDAFISAFSMTIEGVVYQSEVKPKEDAQKAYNEAKAKGQTAGQVKQSSPKETKFTISVSVAARSTVVFNVTYQQLLKRKEGKFENRISIQPGQNVQDVRVEVHVTEPQGLAWINSTWLLSNSLDEHKLNNLTVIDTKQRSGKVLFDTRGEGVLASHNGIMGDFIVTYDVMRDTKAGHLEIVNGYFVHYFSPEGLPKTRKNVVFVIDTSGSMQGRKIAQTKQAFRTILDDVRPIDKFNIVLFESVVRVWREDEMVTATRNNIDQAKEFVNRIRAIGGTNIYEALMKAISLMSTRENDEAYPLIIMLTDGQPTSGPVINTADIISRVTATNEGRMSLFSLGFGAGVDYNFLEKLSLSNQALARKIYEDSSASLQVKGFYDEVANPLLFDINIDYDNELVDTESLTKSTFKAYFDGTEITVAGKLKDDVINAIYNSADNSEHSPILAASNGLELGVIISAKSLDVDIQFNTSTNIETERTLRKHEVESFTQRLWAYLTIKNLLDQRKTTTDKQLKNSFTERALNLSLAYHFVTPLTSLLVVKPEDPTSGRNMTVFDDDQQQLPDNEAESTGGLLPAVPVPQAAADSSLGGPSRRKGLGSRLLSPGLGFPPRSRPKSSADSDPHFLIEIPNTDVNVCFDVNGNPGDAFVLLYDPDIGLSVSADVIPAGVTHIDSKQNGTSGQKVPTYFGKMVVRLGASRSLLITTEDITVDGSAQKLRWGEDVAMRVGEFVVSFGDKRQVTVSRGNNVVVSVMLHRIGAKRAATADTHRVDHLGFYIEEGDGFSDHVHGLVGQFQKQKDVLVSVRSDLALEGLDQSMTAGATATLNIDGREVAVTRKTRRIPLIREYRECWHAADNGHGLIEGVYSDYKLPNIFAQPPSKFRELF